MALTLQGKPTSSSATIDYSAPTNEFSKPSGIASQGTWKEVANSLSPADPGITVSRQTRKMERDVITLGNFSYSWNFGSTRQSGQYTFSNLTAGESKTLSAIVTVKVEKITTHETKTQYRTRTPGTAGTPAEGDKPAVPGKPPGAWTPWHDSGSPTTGTPKKEFINAVPGSKTYTLTVYAKPANFAWGAGVVSEQTIEQSTGLTATKWNELCTKTEQRKNWENQSSSANYSNAEVNAGDWITAAIYNIIASALGQPSVTSGNNGTVITADHFIRLATAVNAS